MSGAIELTDAIQDGGDFQVRHVVEPAEGGTPETVFLTDGSVSDLDPRIDIRSNGDTWVVWWRDTEVPEVLYRVRDQQTTSWEAEVRLSAQGEVARNPSITHDSSLTWISYEGAAAAWSRIVVVGIDDDPEPVPNVTTVATTEFTEPGALVQSVSGHAWVSWVDSATEVAWSEYDATTSSWGSPQTISYEGSSVESARETIRDSILTR